MKNKILNVLSVIVALLFLNAGLNKIFQYIPVPEGLPEAVVRHDAAIAEIKWLLPLVAVVEIVGGGLLVLRKTRALGAIVLLPIMVGVLVFHITVYPEGLLMAGLMAIVLGWIMIENKGKYLQLID